MRSSIDEDKLNKSEVRWGEEEEGEGEEEEKEEECWPSAPRPHSAPPQNLGSILGHQAVTRPGRGCISSSAARRLLRRLFILLFLLSSSFHTCIFASFQSFFFSSLHHPLHLHIIFFLLFNVVFMATIVSSSHSPFITTVFLLLLIELILLLLFLFFLLLLLQLLPNLIFKTDKERVRYAFLFPHLFFTLHSFPLSLDLLAFFSFSQYHVGKSSKKTYKFPRN